MPKLQLSRRSQVVLLIATGVVGFVLCNWIYEYETVLRTNQRNITDQVTDDSIYGAFSPGMASFEPEVQQWRGGAPLTYYLCRDVEGIVIGDHIHWGKLFLNMLIWGAVVGGAAYYFTSTMVKNLKPRRGLTLSDTIILITLLACLFGYMRALMTRASRDSQLYETVVANRGWVVREVAIPKWARSIFPESLYPSMVRTTAVDVQYATDEILDEIAALPYLTALSVRQPSCQPELLTQIVQDKDLYYLGLQSVRVEDALFDTLAEKNQLHCFVAASVEMNEQRINSLSKLSHLKSFALIDSGFPTSEWSRFEFLKQLRCLYVSRPPTGQSGSFQLSGAPDLEYLAVIPNHIEWNRDVMTVGLADLPKLQQLVLHFGQVYNVSLKNLSSLESMEPKVDPEGPLVRYTPVITPSNFMLSGKTQLESLDINVRFLESFSIADNDQVRLRLIPKNSPTSTQIVDIAMRTSREKQKWVDCLGKGSQFRSITLHQLGIENIDLSPLQHQTKLDSLQIHDTILSQAQLDVICSLPQLTEVDLTGCDLEGKDFWQLCRSLPNLKTIGVGYSIANIQQLRLEDHEHFEGFRSEDGTNWPMLQAVQIRNMPKFESTITTAPYCDRLVIENAPSLSGIVMTAPLPTKSSLKELGALQYFAAGGSGFTDEHAAALANADNSLIRLSLPFAQVSEETLAGVDRFQNLTHLTLTGTKLTDDNIAAWDMTRLSKLEMLRIEETSVTTDCLKTLAPLKQLKWLAINVDEAHPLTVEHLRPFTELARLRIAHAKITPEIAEWIGAQDSLRYLDLSHCVWEDDAFKTYQRSEDASLAAAILTDAKVPGEFLKGFLRANRIPYLEITNTESDFAILDRLMGSEKQIQSEENVDGGGFWYPQFTLRANERLPEVNGYPIGTVNPYTFKPRASSEPGFWGRIWGN